MPTQYKAHTFKESDSWETVDTYWSSPLSYWAMKSMRVEPPVPLRVKTMGRVVEESDEGWINYGGLSAVLVQSVQARGKAGQKIRAIISDGTVDEHGEVNDAELL
ncbi:MAG: hypothetical protein ACE37F_23395 [Nannocystaceae bacterium]|nr:hypothetical protein [bacterium]